MKTLTAPVPAKAKIESKPLYSLFEMNGRRWLRISDASYYSNTARFVFHDRIISAFQAGKKVDIREISLD